MNPHYTPHPIHMQPDRSIGSRKSFGSIGGSFSGSMKGRAKSIVGLGYEFYEMHSPGDSKRTLQQQLDYFLATSKFGMMMDVANAILSTASCIVYVAITDTKLEHESSAVTFSEYFFGIAFLLDYVVRFAAARKKLRFLLHWQSMVDLITSLPLLLEWVVVEYDRSSFTFGTVLNFFRVLRVLRTVRLNRLFSFSDSEIKQQVYSMILTVVCMVYLSAGVLHLVENVREWWPKLFEYSDRTFMDMIYMIVTTITTVGYGDIHPVTTPGRVVVMFILFAALVLVPRQTNQLIALMAMTSVYGRQSYKYNRHTQHVIVCGAINSGGVIEFFTELFHPDHGNLNLHAVVIGTGPPCNDMQALLSDPRYAFALTYLDGNVMNEKDLRRASAQYAKGIFMLTNKYSRNIDEDDASAILRLLSIKRFISHENKTQDVFTSVQLLNPESQKLFLSSVDGQKKRQRKNNHIVCVHEIKMNMLAKSCICPGMSTMLCNLISSSDDSTEDKHGGMWLEQYSEGCGYEIYHVKLSNAFEGLTFAEASSLVFRVSHTILFALEINHHEAESRVVLNPGKMVIPDVEEFGIYGFVIAEDSDQASVISTAKSEPGKHKQDLRRIISHSQARLDAESRLVAEISQVKTSKLAATEEVPRYKPNAANPRGGLWANTKNLLKQQIKGGVEYEMRANYFLSDQPVPLEEATLGSVEDHFPPSWGGHIVVVGDVANLYHFILPLRSRHLSCAVPIVILFPTIPAAGAWAKLSVFKDVFFVHGSPLEVGDLRRVKAHTAARAVIFAKEYESQEDQDNALIDADTIFAYSIIANMNPNIEVVGEIVTPSNISFLHDKRRRTRTSTEYQTSPPFAAGRVYTSSMIDTLVCQAYYNPHIITILHQLVAGEDKESVMKWDKHMRHYFQDPVKDSHLYSCRVPEEYWDKEFRELFLYLVARGTVALAIRRGADTDLLGNTLPFVYTAPKGDTILRSTDTVFLLSEEAPAMDSASEMNQGTAEQAKHGSVPDFEEHEVFETKTQSIELEGGSILEKAMSLGESTGMESGKVVEVIQELSKDVNNQLESIQSELTSLVQRISRIERKQKHHKKASDATPRSAI